MENLLWKGNEEFNNLTKADEEYSLAVLDHLDEQIQKYTQANIACTREIKKLQDRCKHLDEEMLELNANENTDQKRTAKLQQLLMGISKDEKEKVESEDPTILHNFQLQLSQITREIDEQTTEYQRLVGMGRELEKSVQQSRKQNVMWKQEIMEANQKRDMNDETLKRITCAIQTIHKSNQPLRMECMQLERKMDGVLKARGLTPRDVTEGAQIEKHEEALTKEKDDLQSEHERLSMILDRNYLQRDNMTREMRGYQAQNIEWRDRYSVSVRENEELRKELDLRQQMLERKRSTHSLEGRLKRRLETLEREHIELKRNKSALQRNSAVSSI